MRLLLSVCCLFSLLLFRNPLSAAETRIWTDSSGQFKIEAEFVRIQDEKVILKKTDGKTQSVPLAKLSKADRDYAVKQAENPFEADDTEPVKAKNSASKPRETGESATLFDVPAKPIRLQNAASISSSAETQWSLAPDPALVTKLTKKPRSVAFQVGKFPFSTRTKDAGFFVYGTADAPKVLYAVQVDMSNVTDNSFRPSSANRQAVSSESADSSRTLVFPGDLATGKGTALTFPQKITPFGVSPDGTKALFRKEEWGRGLDTGKKKYLYIVRIEDGKLLPAAAFEPFAGSSRNTSGNNTFGDRDSDIEWAAWVDDKNILVESGKHQLALVNTDSGEAVWQCSVTGNAHRVLSPGGRYMLAGRSGHRTALLETKTGEVLGELADTIPYSFADYAFSPDGSKIASYYNSMLKIWDAATGKSSEAYYIGEQQGLPFVRWTDNRYLLASQHLIDTETQSPLWSYRGLTNNPQFFAGYLWYRSGISETKTITGIVLPHPEALTSVNLPEEQRFALLPGTEVTLQIEDSLQEGRNEIQKHFQKVIEDNGWVLKPDAEIKLILKVSKEPPEKIVYTAGRGFAPPILGRSGGTEITFTPGKFSIEIQKEGKAIWSRFRRQLPPNNISLDEIKQKSLQSIVDKAVRKAEYKEWFLESSIPKKIPNTGLAGESILSESGMSTMSAPKPVKK